jgi:type IV pilus assembly protein PilE
VYVPGPKGVCLGGRGRLVRTGAASRAGFTLTELLIAVAIVGILAAIAYPSYLEQIRKSRRADAEAVLMQAAQFMERIYSEAGCYNPGPDGLCGTADDAAPTLPYAKSPIDGRGSYYGISFQVIDATSFTLQATPRAGTSQEGTGALTVNSLGEKRWE